MFAGKEFYFMRHGETDHNANNVLAGGDCDIPLNDMGREQAFLVKSLVESLPIRAICHSPLKRAVETMKISSSALSLERLAIEDLKECLARVWTLMSARKSCELHGEEVLSFFSQVVRGVNRALSCEEPVLIVAHGGVHWAICEQLGIEGHNWDIGNCQLVHFFPAEEDKWNASLLE